MRLSMRNSLSDNALRSCSAGVPRRVAGLVLLTCVLGACDRGSSVTVSGDIPGLDTLGYRGDSLLAQADRGPADLLDSMRVQKERTAAASGTDAGTIATPPTTVEGDSATEPGAEPVEPTAGQAMSRRAQARGDSMARAIAQKLAGGTDVSGRTRGDSVRGIVTFVGAEPARQVVLRADGNNIALSGMATTGLNRLVGTEVMVRGVKITPRDIVVSDYIVRASNGVPAFDGTLEDGGTLRLTDGSGRKRLSSMPSALRSMVGARVWVAIKDGSTAADSYGIIGRR